MFEGWVADLLASSLGRFIDVQRDSLRISLWSGEAPDNSALRSRSIQHMSLLPQAHTQLALHSFA
jgi:hypothetical protein